MSPPSVSPHPLGIVRQLPLFLSWVESDGRDYAVWIPAIDEEEAAHRLAKAICQRHGQVMISICVESNHVITIFDVTPRLAVLYDVARRTVPLKRTRSPR